MCENTPLGFAINREGSFENLTLERATLTFTLKAHLLLLGE